MLGRHVLAEQSLKARILSHQQRCRRIAVRSRVREIVLARHVGGALARDIAKLRIDHQRFCGRRKPRAFVGDQHRYAQLERRHERFWVGRRRPKCLVDAGAPSTRQEKERKDN